MSQKDPTETGDTAKKKAVGVPFGRYQLLRKIATGGMAQLYLATITGEADFQKLCVVKKILPHLAEQPHFVDMFLDEARIAATLNHPNIVQIYDLGRVGSAYFIAMEYIAGEDLARIYKRARKEKLKLPIEVCCRIAADLCAGLHHAHEHRDLSGKHLGIVHRDVSPQNVLVTYAGQIKVVDFGIAKAANKVAHTRTGTIMGKAAYMSPEQCMGETLDPRSDVFAVGTLLYEMLSQKRLFKRENELLTMRAIADEDAPLLSTRRPNVPAELETVVMKSLARDRDQRFGSCLEMRGALENFIASFGVPATSLELSTLLEDLFPDHVQRQSQAREAGSLSEVIRALPSTGIKDLGTPSSLSQDLLLTQTQTSDLISVPSKQLEAAQRWRRLTLWGLVLALLTAVLGGAAYVLLKPTPTGHLVLSSTPNGALVLLDSEPRGRTPLSLENLTLDHPYQLVVTATGHLPHSENLFLTGKRPNREVHLVLKIAPSAAEGTLEVTTEPPGATVFLDGVATDKVTPTRFDKVPAELEHKIRVELKDFHPEERMVLLRDDDTKVISLALRRVAKVPVKSATDSKPSGKRDPKPKRDPAPVVRGKGLLTLRTSPWTVVYHGSVELGETPLFKVELPAGAVKLRLVNQAKGIDKTITVQIKKAGITTVDKKL